MKLQLKGWAAVPAIVVVLLFVGYRTMAAGSAFDGDQGDLLKLHLQGEYTSHTLPGMREAFAAGDKEDLADRVEAMVELDDIEFTSVRIKGVGEEVVVKVTIEVAGETPPDGRTTRFYRLRHQNLGGWKILREVSSFQYYLKLF